MRQVGVLEVKTHLSEFLDGIEQKGEDFVITRHGRPIARLSSFHEHPRRQMSGPELLAAFKNLRDRIAEEWPEERDFDWKAAVEDGRE